MRRAGERRAPRRLGLTLTLPLILALTLTLAVTLTLTLTLTYTQASGGLFTDWEPVAESGWSRIGYPIDEVREDGSFSVAKPEGTGGLVSVGTVAEQLLYEIGDPGAYHCPDVACDFTQVQAEQEAHRKMDHSELPPWPLTLAHTVCAGAP